MHGTMSIKKEESDYGTLVGIFSVLYKEFSSYGKVKFFIFIKKHIINTVA